MVVLGVSANSRILGLAIINGNQLIDFKAQLHTEQWSIAKANKMIASLYACIKEYAITTVALAIPRVYHTSPETSAFITALKTFCFTKKISISAYKQPALHRLCEASKAKKKALMKAMARRYPELIHLYHKEMRNKHEYYHKLFEAVAVATLLIAEYNY